MARRRSVYRVPKLKLKTKTIAAVAALVSLALAGLSVISFVTDVPSLQFWRDLLYEAMGWTSIIAPVIFALSALVLQKVKWGFAQPNVLLGLILIVVSLSGLTAAFSIKMSGSLGVTLWEQLASFVTVLGAGLLLVGGFLVGLVVLFNTSLSQIFKIFTSSFGFISKLFQSVFNRPKSFKANNPIKISGMQDSAPKVVKKETVMADELVQNVAGETKVWKYPPLSLLSDKNSAAAASGDIKKNAATIEKTLESFGVGATVAEVNGGPAVTQYALKISAGTKIAKIANLQHDLALSLATPTGTVRVEAPIPGKSLVGIEVPNKTLEVVGLRGILASDEMAARKSKLAVALGRDTASAPIIVDLDRMPHALIAGTTGSGKSVLMNTIITTLLFRNSPQELKLILIDPKRVELTNYNGIPHLLTPVIIEPELEDGEYHYSLSTLLF